VVMQQAPLLDHSQRRAACLDQRDQTAIPSDSSRSSGGTHDGRGGSGCGQRLVEGPLLPAPPSPRGHVRLSPSHQDDTLNKRWAHAMTPTGWAGGATTMPARLRSKPGRRGLATAASSSHAVPGLAALDRQVGGCVRVIHRKCVFTSGFGFVLSTVAS
jgi:hypothetical protein